jgi:methylated-DNA-[protein]-cysteine S-methyltransferase
MVKAMSVSAFALFPTAIGPCALAWSEAGLTGVWFPEPTDEATRERIRRRLGDIPETEPPAAVRDSMARIAELLETGRADLTTIALDMEGIEAFERRVLEAAREIRPGATATYGELAAKVGAPRATREVGQAMARNRFPIVVPCHRVLAAGGGFGGFSAPGGLESKARLLNIERAAVGAEPSLFDDLPIAVRPRG